MDDLLVVARYSWVSGISGRMINVALLVGCAPKTGWRNLPTATGAERAGRKLTKIVLEILFEDSRTTNVIIATQSLDASKD